MKKMMIIIVPSILVLLGVIIAFMAYNKVVPIGLGMHKPVFQVNNIAMDGYDVTSYFENNIKRGKPEFAVTHLGVDWYFSSVDRLSQFKADPEKYIPQFGGYCSKAVSTGFTAPADPTIYTIHEKKLYVFSSEEVKENFLLDPSKIIDACESKWK